MSSSTRSTRQKNCNSCVKSKRRCDKRQPACSRCVKQRYLCVYGGQEQTGITFDNLADAAFGLDDAAHSTLNSDTFMAAPNAPPTILGTGMGLASDANFQLNDNFSSLFAPIPGNSSFLEEAWPSQLTGIPGIPHEKTVIRKDYSKMAPECVSRKYS